MQQLKQIRLKNVLMLALAGVVNACGIVFFLYPVQLYDSGISGTSMLVAQLTPEFLPLSLFLVVLNVPLFLYGLRRQGLLFTVYAIYAVGVYALTAWLITDVLPVDVSFTSPLAGRDLLLCALFGGVISGVGSGLAMRYGGVMDGIEVMAVIFAKKLGLSVGTFCMLYNVLLYVVCGVILQSWILPLYSIVTYAAALKTVDFIVEGIDRAKAAMIVTVRPDEICDALSSAFETGATVIDAKGGYSGSDKTVVYFVVNRFQVSRMKHLVHEVDPTAFITITEVVDVFSSNQSLAAKPDVTAALRGVTLAIGTDETHRTVYHVVLDENTAQFSATLPDGTLAETKALDRAAFLRGLSALHTERWQRVYPCKETPPPPDAERWQVTLTYADGKTGAYAGTAAFPENFDGFLSLFHFNDGVEFSQEEN